MRTHRFASHTPEEKRRLSNAGHIVEGALLGAVGVLALLATAGLASWAAMAWAILLLLAGALLLLLIYPRHPVADWRAIWADAQQREHTLMAGAIALAGAAELARANSPTVSVLAFVWPASACFIGALFLIHEQHGTGAAMTQAVMRHRLLGATIITAGLLRVAEIVFGVSAFAFLWPLALLLASAQLMLYREPEGAYEEGAHGGHGDRH